MSKITSRAEETNANETFSFPCLRKHKASGAVYLFYSIETGTVVTGVALGEVVHKIDQSHFKNFTGIVHIKGE